MENINNNQVVNLTKEDFVSDQIVKWCPGCGDHAILKAVEAVFPKLGKKKEDIVVVSGIGCSSRFPYYMNTYGFHSIHGRAAAIATGVKLANPNLSVWVVTGDGDCTAIGGNHFIHAVRRNIDMNLLLFNNRIYGLTKGQFSPCTFRGTVTKTSPQGTYEDPFNVGELVIGAGGKFFARGVDINTPELTDICLEAKNHDGLSVVEILQNCMIFSNGIHENITGKEVRDDMQVKCVHGQPLIFGKNRDKGIVLRGNRLEVATIGENGVTEADILVHDEKEKTTGIHMMLAHMAPPEFPVAIGVIRNVDAPTYNQCLDGVIENETAKSSIKCVDDLLNSGSTWDIE
ncbi:MAG: 2-oxoacid:ferredoxin oxidoreductase subunit beta [Bacteroidales bacterium]|jgi:2-oxoglutarate ferredoxin oxidoreductase subunit beta|nr:2-oxoacid:ferredoxin oxidoreductase subunit beta [Bacteroidales bacterium]